MPQEAQLLAAQVPQPEEALVLAGSPGDDDLDTNPHADRSRERSLLLQEGHAGVSDLRTRVSKLWLHWLHWYSYIGILPLKPYIIMFR
jgi:hypothetical protein